MQVFYRHKLVGLGQDFANIFIPMNSPAAEQRGICKGNETPQAAGN
jgi:hypothetical protein